MQENDENAVRETGDTPAESASNSAHILNTLIPDTDTQGGEGAQESPGGALAIPSAVDSLAGLLSLVGIVAEFRGYMRVATVWSGEACHELAAKLVPVFMKYSWGQRLIHLLQNGGGIEELALFPVAMGMITATYAAFRADSEAMKPKEPVQEEMEPGKVYDVGSPLGSTVKRQYED